MTNFLDPVLTNPSFETALPLLQMILSTAQSPNDLGNYWQCVHTEPSTKYCKIVVQQPTPLSAYANNINELENIAGYIPGLEKKLKPLVINLIFDLSIQISLVNTVMDLEKNAF